MTQKQQNTLLRLSLVIARRAQPDEAIHLAVAHRPSRSWAPQEWRNLLSENAVVVDVQGSAPRLELEEAGVRVWRL
jgi:hypothetical protein